MAHSALGLSKRYASDTRFWLDPAWPAGAAALLELLRPRVPERVFRYFANEHRLRLPVALCRRHAPTRGSLLNLGSGCGLLDLALESAGFGQITAIDCDPRVESAYRQAIECRLLRRTEFIAGSWDDVDTLVRRRYDVILAWDALYYPGTDVFALLPKLAPLLAPSGVLIFDLRDARFVRVSGPLYRRVAGRFGSSHYLWHDMREVIGAARRHFDLIATGPKSDSTVAWRRVFTKALTYTLGLSVGRYLVLMRRGEPPA